MSPLPVNNCKIQAYALHDGLCAGKDLDRAIPALTQEPWFTRSLLKDLPTMLSCHL